MMEADLDDDDEDDGDDDSRHCDASALTPTVAKGLPCRKILFIYT